MGRFNELKILNIFENSKPMFVERIIIHKRKMTLTIPFEASFGKFDSLIRLFPEIVFKFENGETVSGMGECSPLTAPWYDSECHRTTEIGLKFIIACLTGKNYEDADGYPLIKIEPVTDIFSFISRYKWIVGHNIAKTGIEGAYWDALAKFNSVPVSAIWGGIRKKVETGTSIGIQASPDDLIKKIDHAVNKLKVARVKIKVKPGKDISYVERIRNSFPDLPLQVDANAAYNLFDTKHLSTLKEMDNFDLTMIEQPGRNDDIIDHARQLAMLKTPICMDESILSTDNTRHAIDLWRQYSTIEKLIINVKPPRVGGYLEAIKIAKLCNENGVSVWCGGMLESALGKTANVHFSSRDEINLPGDHVSQAPYFLEDVGDSPHYEDGKITVPKGIGWGIRNLNVK